MAISKENAQVLARQLQEAHRYAAGFYRCFLDAMNDAANSHGFEATGWGPAKFAKPAFRKSTPANNWTWDLLPMCYTVFSFTKRQNKQAMLDIFFTPNPGLLIDSYPDPFAMGEEEPGIAIWFYTAGNELPDDTDIDELWKATEDDFPEEIDVFVKCESGLVASRLEVPLADFMAEPEECIRKGLGILIERQGV